MELTDRTIALLQEKGWVRYDIENDQGYCVLGALGVANSRMAGAHDERRRQMGRVIEAIGRVLRTRCETRIESYNDIPYWNDQVARDADEVIEVLKLAGELADQPRR